MHFSGFISVTLKSKINKFFWKSYRHGPVATIFEIHVWYKHDTLLFRLVVLFSMFSMHNAGLECSISLLFLFFSSLHLWHHFSMLTDRCTKVVMKACLSVLRGCRWITVHRRHTYCTRVTPWTSCNYICSAYRHSHNSAAAVSFQKLKHRSLVRVCGADVLGFLQGLVTNDVKLLETDNSAMYAMMLNVQACI